MRNRITILNTNILDLKERYKRGIDYIQSIGEDAMYGRRTK